MGRQVVDVGILLRFRAGTVRRPLAVRVALAAFVVMTAAAAVFPAVAARRIPDGEVLVDIGELPVDAAFLDDVLIGQLPGALAAFVALAVTSAVAVGGGRELLSRDPAAVHPIGPVTDHLGALLLAPVSATWLVPFWGLLAASGWASADQSPGRIVAVWVVVSAWVALGTALGQIVAWSVEWLRRGPHGVPVVRTLTAVLVLGSGAVLWRSPETLVAGPAEAVAATIAGNGSGAGALGGLGVLGVAVVLLVIATALVVLGALPAAAAGRRAPRDEARIETSPHRARPDATSERRALLRIDRASVWRSLPLRRGTVMLALAPGLFALVVGMDWWTLTVLPGLVASGCVLLFGVNVWCLDGRGALWRASLPVAPAVVFDARCWVVAELLLGAGLSTIALGCLRAGAPSSMEALTAVAVLVVVTGQALSGGMRWSLRSPYPVDLRSARATPAPPLVMIGYSARLALTTTFTALFLATCAVTGRAAWILLPALVLLAWSAMRLALSRRRWTDPTHRARVISVVAA